MLKRNLYSVSAIGTISIERSVDDSEGEGAEVGECPTHGLAADGGRRRNHFVVTGLTDRLPWKGLESNASATILLIIRLVYRDRRRPQHPSRRYLIGIRFWDETMGGEATRRFRHEPQTLGCSSLPSSTWVSICKP
ncbi:hypothetical protein GUJ93_ZPchr0002g23919 [Zizania palustris]|uniref:Uncharacterized protein n=1 Tax=Zizania palustris TaxID=103762 RepID=A0A8J5SM32_ZIZPA|nr:hypothetical protein GUJ93_ZPchr0002g23919 [Zizania palustris]